MDNQSMTGKSTGRLRITVKRRSGRIPVNNASVEVSLTGQPGDVFAEIRTDSNGFTDSVPLPAPDESYSLEPGDTQPYSEYNLKVKADGYEESVISGIQLLPNVTAEQEVLLNPAEPDETPSPIVIDAHTLWEQYPPKIPEAEVKPVEETGEIVLSRVVIPEFIIVHDGSPQDSTAPNYYVTYQDYIKNVVSSEIYSTWPESAIYANVLAVMSFTLNRVYTEWYRSQGYMFTITSSTAFDQKWTRGRNTYENIDFLVDSIFNNYLSRPGIKQPIFTSYCDGRNVNCAGLSQWGSKYLADEGYTAIEILRYYYGSDIYINSSDFVAGVPASWPGYALNIGASGQKVVDLQRQLNRIAQDYPAIPVIEADGIYGPRTAEAVTQFQRIFGLPANGITDFTTWYRISAIYVGVSRLSEQQT